MDWLNTLIQGSTSAGGGLAAGTVLAAAGAAIAWYVRNALLLHDSTLKLVESLAKRTESLEEANTTLEELELELRGRIRVLEAESAKQQRRIDALSAENDQLRRRLAQFSVGIGKLIQQITELEHIPAWKPDDFDLDK